MIIKRAIETKIEQKIGTNKVLLILGTRRVGKTFLLKTILHKLNKPVINLNGEDFDVQQLLKNITASNYRLILGESKILVIDEAQAIPEIGKILKFMIDTFPALTIIATGS